MEVVFAIPFRRVLKPWSSAAGPQKFIFAEESMSKQPRVIRSQRKIIGDINVVNPDAAGIDAGSEEHWVAVPKDRCEQPIRRFSTFTEDLYKLADWLVECRVTTVAIEATGVYWIPLIEVLEERGLNPQLVDSRSIGRRNKKTDCVDCEWLRQLHTCGLLDPAFRPKAEMLALRAFMRQRRMLIEYASDHIRHMQKALDLMNLKLHLVLSDIVGATGLRIIRAIVGGEHDPHVLAAMRDRNCKNTEETIAKALMGNYREEHLFALQQAVNLFDTYQKKIEECDQKIAATLTTFEKKGDAAKLGKKKTTKSKSRSKNHPHFDGRTLLYEMTGVDLTAIDGLDVSSVLTILSETGTDVSAWPTESNFGSWLALSPNNRITGGKLIRKKGPVIRPNRAAQAFRLAAQTLARSHSALGAFFRRMRARQGWAGAIKATAHKLATIFYSMLKNKTEYRDAGENYYEERYRQRLINSLKRNATALGFQLVPVQEVH
jgi:transposase